MNKRILSLSCVFGMVAGLASVQASTVVSYKNINNIAVANLNGYITSDIQLTTDKDWTATALSVTLTSGSVYNTPTFGADTTPNSAFFLFMPELQFDSYVNGTIAGGAVDFGGSTGVSIAGSLVNVSWFNQTTSDIGTLTMARMSLSRDAVGTFSIKVNTNGNPSLIQHGNITTGQFIIPEPASLSLLVLGSLGIFLRRR